MSFVYSVPPRASPHGRTAVSGRPEARPPVPAVSQGGEHPLRLAVDYTPAVLAPGQSPGVLDCCEQPGWRGGAAASAVACAPVVAKDPRALAAVLVRPGPPDDDQAWGHALLAHGADPWQSVRLDYGVRFRHVFLWQAMLLRADPEWVRTFREHGWDPPQWQQRSAAASSPALGYNPLWELCFQWHETGWSPFTDIGGPCPNPEGVLDALLESGLSWNDPHVLRSNVGVMTRWSQSNPRMAASQCQRAALAAALPTRPPFKPSARL